MNILKTGPLLVSIERGIMPNLPIKKYTDKLGRLVTQTSINYTDGLGAKLVIKSPNGSKVVSEGLYGVRPFKTKYYDKNRRLTREIISDMYEKIYTKDGHEIFISHDMFGRTGRDVRINFANSPERYEITSAQLPNGEETFVLIDKYIKRKLSAYWPYLKYKFFGKTQKKFLSYDEMCACMNEIKNFHHEHYLEEIAAEAILKADTAAGATRIINMRKKVEPYPAKEIREILKRTNYQ